MKITKEGDYFVAEFRGCRMIDKSLAHVVFRLLERLVFLEVITINY